MTRTGTLAAWCFCLAALAAAASSCGPSFRRTAESDNAFLRCFDLDYRPVAAAAEKTTCWEGWLDDHVYNQPEDKVAYARLRLEELARGVSIPGPPGPPGAFDGRPAGGAETGPAQEAGAAPTEDAGVAGSAPDAGAAR